MTTALRRSTVYDALAPRQPVHLSLNSDLLTRVKEFTPNLSATIEILLGRYLEAASSDRRDERQRLDQLLDALNLMHEQNGFLSDDFSAL